MENTDGNGKGLSYLPLIMLALAVYVIIKLVYPDNRVTKVYLINPPAEGVPAKNSSLAVAATSKSPEPVQWTAMRSSASPKVIKTLPANNPPSSEKAQLSFSPPPISTETQVEQLLAQGETVPEIAKQTGLKVKEVRKIKRRKKVDEKLPDSQQQASSLTRLKQKLFFWQ
ncbi:hypothetical protein Q0590_24365 [Rhodocytophaga aerolata]|uniref:Helix-turn-helix domain-containing protein n=1 Tax=Rhodocytophaga aerolata TaxID=455078 RepID=A0ABT8RBE0_9BACT|nr:hypothetical protein [Rhodocytophaga aerolata]MDO1449432.1 hypothetical protein [Rhodocytophaga aerolata]